MRTLLRPLFIDRNSLGLTDSPGKERLETLDVAATGQAVNIVKCLFWWD